MVRVHIQLFMSYHEFTFIFLFSVFVRLVALCRKNCGFSLQQVHSESISGERLAVCVCLLSILTECAVHRELRFQCESRLLACENTDCYRRGTACFLGVVHDRPHQSDLECS